MHARHFFSRSVILWTVGFACTMLCGQEKVEYAIVIHGGAGSAKIDADVVAARTRSLSAYLRLGSEMLKQGSQSLDVVEAVIRELEDDPLFNAGKGAVYNSEGGHELTGELAQEARGREGGRGEAKVKGLARGSGGSGNVDEGPKNEVKGSAKLKGIDAGGSRSQGLGLRLVQGGLCGFARHSHNAHLCHLRIPFNFGFNTGVTAVSGGAASKPI